MGRRAECTVTVKDGVIAGPLAGSDEILEITVGETGVIDPPGENIAWR